MLILTFLAAAALACDPFQGLEGLFKNTSEPHSRIISRRWADRVSNLNARGSLWPRDPVTKVVTIRYCFSDHEAWQRWGSTVYYGAVQWNARLGPIGTESGNGVIIELHDRTSPTPPPFCWSRQPSGIFQYDGVWNSDVHPNSVVVWSQYTQGKIFGASATWGFVTGGNENRIVISFDQALWTHASQPMANIASIAHEFGHTFGLGHEHQRPDRDQWVHFDCSRLPGYSNALLEIQRRQAAGQQAATIEQICDDFNLAHEYNFPVAADYYKEPLVNMGPFDMDSIMLYQSNAPDIYSAPLVKWTPKIPDGAQIPTQRTPTTCGLIPLNVIPSMQDVFGVRGMYPYQAPQ